MRTRISESFFVCNYSCLYSSFFNIHYFSLSFFFLFTYSSSFICMFFFMISIIFSGKQLGNIYQRSQNSLEGRCSSWHLSLKISAIQIRNFAQRCSMLYYLKLETTQMPKRGGNVPLTSYHLKITFRIYFSYNIG